VAGDGLIKRPLGGTGFEFGKRLHSILKFLVLDRWHEAG
jgi:hypothetical protein